MAEQAASWNDLQNVYGLQQSDINSLQSKGYTADQASQLLSLSVNAQAGPPRYTGTGGSSTASVATPPTIGGSGLTPQMLTQLAQIFAPQGGQQQQAAPPPQPQPTGPGSQPTWATDQQASGQGAAQPQAAQQAAPSQSGGSQAAAISGGTGPQASAQRNYQNVGVDPQQPYINLGAAVLGQPAYYPPGMGPGSGGGTGQDNFGTSSQSGFTGGGGLTIGGISTAQPQTTTSGVIPAAPRGPWTNTPGLFMKAPTLQPTAALAVTPTPYPTGTPYQAGQPWATPPPAPTLNLQGAPGPMGGPPPAPGGMGGLNPPRDQGLAVKMEMAAPAMQGGGPGVQGAATALGTKGTKPT